VPRTRARTAGRSSPRWSSCSGWSRATSGASWRSTSRGRGCAALRCAGWLPGWLSGWLAWLAGGAGWRGWLAGCLARAAPGKHGLAGVPLSRRGGAAAGGAGGGGRAAPAAGRAGGADALSAAARGGRGRAALAVHGGLRAHARRQPPGLAHPCIRVPRRLARRARRRCHDGAHLPAGRRQQLQQRRAGQGHAQPAVHSRAQPAPLGAQLLRLQLHIQRQRCAAGRAGAASARAARRSLPAHSARQQRPARLPAAGPPARQPAARRRPAAVPTAASGPAPQA
jgi:hypothetical protein